MRQPSNTLSGFFFFFQAEDGIRDYKVTGVQTCALPISLLRRAGELLRRRGVLERAEGANPPGEPALGVPPGEMGELEVGMTVDESLDDGAVGELKLPRAVGRGHRRGGAHRRELPTVVNENGAVCDGRRRHGVHGAGAEAEHPRRYGETPMPNGACTGQACDGSVPG